MAENIDKLKNMTPPRGMDFHIADLERASAFYTQVLGQFDNQLSFRGAAEEFRIWMAEYETETRPFA